MIRDACPGDCDGLAEFFWWRETAGALFFVGRDRQLWRSDGTAAGTRRFTDLPEGFSSGFHDSGVATLGTDIFFAAGTPDVGMTLWASDGRPGGSRVVTGLAPIVPGADPDELVALGEKLLFTACDGTSTEVWMTEGPAAPPTRLTLPEGDSGCGGLPPSSLGRIAEQVFFWNPRSLEDGGYESQLWRTDGTVAGTRLLTTFQRLVASLPFFDFKGQALFLAQSGGSTIPEFLEIWTSDGTPEGTREAFDLPGELISISSLHMVGDEIYLVVQRGEIQGEVWRSDGTTAGTRRILAGNIREPFHFARLGAAVLFLSAEGGGGGGLWKTDGTAAGTVLLRELPLHQFIPPADLTVFQGAAYFIAAASPRARALWRSDGTAAGTAPVEELGWDPSELTLAAGRLFFTADGVSDTELWQSDGTAAGTVRVRDIVPGLRGSSPRSLREAGGRLFFVADDHIHGAELWQSDGTEAGTRLVHDLAPGLVHSIPRDLTVAGSSLYFSADDGYTGRELWRLPLSGPAACQPAPDQLCLGGGRFRVEARWRDFAGQTGRGTAVPLTDETGTFWFFGPENVEVVAKVLDGQAVNGHHWVFYGALSNVEYSLTVTDTQTGATNRYFNPLGQLASVGDTTGFGPLGAKSSRSSERVAPPSPPALVAERVVTAAATGTCQAGPARLCLNGGRFAVEASWKAQGQSGAGTAVALTGDTGTFWFFGPDNVEVVVKVLDGTSLNGKHWVFYGALSDVEYTLTITDTQTGTVRTYANPKGRMASVADTGAF